MKSLVLFAICFVWIFNIGFVQNAKSLPPRPTAVPTITWNNATGSSFGMVCTQDLDCTNYDNQTKCENSKCVCKEQFQTPAPLTNLCYKNPGPSIGRMCAENKDCTVTDPNSLCSTKPKRCICKRGFDISAYTGYCVVTQGPGFNRYCLSNVTCLSHDLHTYCESHQCLCDKDYVPSQITKHCLPTGGSQIDEYCETYEECRQNDYYSYCDTKEQACKCKEDFEPNKHGVCVLKTGRIVVFTICGILLITIIGMLIFGALATWKAVQIRRAAEQREREQQQQSSSAGSLPEKTPVSHTANELSNQAF